MKRKFFILVLCLALVAACFGCHTTGARKASGNMPSIDPNIKEATWQQHTDPVKLTIATQIMAKKDRPTSPEPPDWNEDPVSRLIMSLTGVQLVLEKQNPGLSLDVMLASGEMTDLICLASKEQFYLLENGEICYGLDELLVPNCPDFWDDRDPLERLNNQAPDGHTYTLRAGYNSTAVYADDRIPINPPWTMNIRTDKLEKLGGRMPASVEELESLLYRAKASGLPPPIGCSPPPRRRWPGGWE